MPSGFHLFQSISLPKTLRNSYRTRPSLITLNLDHKDTQVTNRFFINSYEFEDKVFIYGPYMATLGVAAIILIMGTVALWQNGVPAEDSFLNIVCATRVSESMDMYARIAATGGAMSIPKELEDLDLMFGGSGDNTQLTVGFGVPGEVHMLQSYVGHRIVGFGV
jgi:hypothetical protein